MLRVFFMEGAGSGVVESRANNTDFSPPRPDAGCLRLHLAKAIRIASSWDKPYESENSMC